MQSKIFLRSISKSTRLVYTAVFASLCLVATLLIRIPLANGYFNLGDVFVLLSAWCLGPIYGTISAAIGCALADVISGFMLYAPATFFIKALTAVMAWLIYDVMKRFIKKEALDFIPRTIAAIFAQTCMVAGYFLFECILYGFVGATLSLWGNTLQGVCGGIGGVGMVVILYSIKSFQMHFPALHK